MHSPGKSYKCNLPSKAYPWVTYIDTGLSLIYHAKIAVKYFLRHDLIMDILMPSIDQNMKLRCCYTTISFLFLNILHISFPFTLPYLLVPYPLTMIHQMSTREYSGEVIKSAVSYNWCQVSICHPFVISLAAVIIPTFGVG